MSKALVTALLWATALSAAASPPSAGSAAALAALLEKHIEGFASVEGQWNYRFPADHGAHTDYRTETWRITGTVADRGGQRFAFQLAFLRLGVNPPASTIGPSAWAARDIYVAHFALADVATGRFDVFEQWHRGAMDFAGARSSPARVWAGDWALEASPAQLRIRAAEKHVGIELSLHAAKPAVVRSGAGVHAYAMTRLEAHGVVRLSGRTFDAAGTAWLDRAWGAVPLPLGAVVWDRFSVQFDDATELMVLRLRRKDGIGRPTLSGVLVQPDGSIRMLAHDELAVEAVEHWSSRAGTRYTTGWRLRVPGEDLAFDLSAVLPQQVIAHPLRYWSGAVDARGVRGGVPLEGVGHVESPGDEPPAR